MLHDRHPLVADCPHERGPFHGRFGPVLIRAALEELNDGLFIANPCGVHQWPAVAVILDVRIRPLGDEQRHRSMNSQKREFTRLKADARSVRHMMLAA